MMGRDATSIYYIKTISKFYTISSTSNVNCKGEYIIKKQQNLRTDKK